MTGLDFFSAIYRQGVDLPVRIFTEGNNPNFYRPDALTFCNLTLEDGDEIDPGSFDLLTGFDVSIVADKMTDQIRDLARAIIPSKPKHLAVIAGETFASWAPHRGWA